MISSCYQKYLIVLKRKKWTGFFLNIFSLENPFQCKLLFTYVCAFLYLTNLTQKQFQCQKASAFCIGLLRDYIEACFLMALICTILSSFFLLAVSWHPSCLNYDSVSCFSLFQLTNIVFFGILTNVGARLKNCPEREPPPRSTYKVCEILLKCSLKKFFYVRIYNGISIIFDQILHN